MFRRNMEQYDKYCDDYEDNEDAETLANIEKYEDRLKYFIKNNKHENSLTKMIDNPLENQTLEQYDNLYINEKF